MKSWSIAQRLFALLAFVLVLLLVGVLLVVRADRREYEAADQHGRFVIAAEQVRYEMLVVTDADASMEPRS